MAENDFTKMSFETALAELEQVVGQLESGSVPLEESIKLYERGAKLKAHCEAKLRSAEEKIAQITLGPDGKPSGAKAIELE